MLKEKIHEYVTSQQFTSLAATTRQGYGIALKDLEAFCDENDIFEIDDIEPRMPDLAKFFQAKGITDQTIYQKFTCIKIFLKWTGFPSEYTFSISNKGKKAFKLKHARRWLSSEEIAQCRAYQFANGYNLRDRLIVALLIETGCRAKELATVKGSDIEMEEGVLFFTDSKTEPRPGFFSRETYRVMVKYRQQIGEAAWEKKIFPSVGRIQEVVNGMLKNLGLKNANDGRGPHVFRHYFASHLFFVGDMRIEEVSILMGDTVDTVQNVYLHCPADVLKQKTRKAMGWR